MHAFMEWIVWTEKHSVAVVTAMFTVILLTNFWPGSRKLERHAAIPLDDDV